MMITDYLLELIRKAPNREKIARESGVDSGALTRYAKGQRPITNARDVDKLCQYWGLELKKLPKKKVRD